MSGFGTTEKAETLQEKGEATMVDAYPWRRVASQSFAEAIRDYPGVQSTTDFRLLLTLVLSVQPDNPDQHIAVPFERIAECMGQAGDIRHRNELRGENSTGEVLKDFISRVLPEVGIIEYDYKRNLARELVGVPDAISDNLIDLREEAFNYGGNGDRVYLDYPIQEVTPHRRHRRKQESESNQENWISNAVCEPQRRLLHYLHETSRGGRSSKFKPDDGALDSAFDLATRPEKSTRGRLNALSQLAAIENDPVPRYKPSYEGNTVRVFTSGYSLCTIDKSLRRALQPDWIELDLSSAQLAIVAQDWGLTKVNDFLESGRSIWDELYDSMGWAEYQGGISRKCAKPVLKKGLYAAVFGAAKSTVKENMYDTYISSPHMEDFLIFDSFMDKIFDDPLVSELMSRRNERLDEISENGGDIDAFGNEVKIAGETKATSVLAQLAQSRELQLLLPALEVAKDELDRVEGTDEEPRFWITLWQHDGFSIHVRDPNRRSSHVEDFKGAVNGTAGSYKTELEVDYPQGEFD